MRRWGCVIAGGLFFACASFATDSAISQRVTSIFLSQTFINEQIKAHVHPGLLNDLSVELSPKENEIYFRGLLKIPTEELKAINLDPALGEYRFQLTIRPEATKEGYLILEFPLNETFFYPASSKNPKRDRVIVPVQMLSLALASARGYFSALSGDFSSFDRRKAKTLALIRALDRAIRLEKNADALDAMKTERESLRLQLAAIPIERKQLQKMSAQFEGMMGFTGEKELNLNDQFAARQNALILKLNLGRFVPFLTGVELGGVRILHDSHDGPKGENFFSIDIHAQMSVPEAVQDVSNRDDHVALRTPPSAVIRINQALFESELIVAAEKQSMGDKLQDLKIELREDGMHVVGKFHKLFFTIPFDTIVDFDSMDPDSFEVSVRDIEVAGLDVEFLSGWVLESVKNRLDQTLKGMCTFEYIGEKKDNSRALLVTVDPKKLVPALADLHIVDVGVKDREFLFKVGKTGNTSEVKSPSKSAVDSEHETPKTR